MLRKFGVLITIFSLEVACQKAREISFDDKSLSIAGGALLQNGKPLNGKIIQKLGETNARKEISYQDGFEHGLTRTWNEQGILIEERSYSKGKKHGIHRGWHNNGKIRFQSNFENGKYVGDQFSWHENGQVFEYKKYSHEGKMLAAKMFRETGQIYTSQAFDESGAAYGLPGSKLCNPITHEKNKLKKATELQKKG